MADAWLLVLKHFLVTTQLAETIMVIFVKKGQKAQNSCSLFQEPSFLCDFAARAQHNIMNIDRTLVKLMSHLQKMTKLPKWKSDKN